MSVERLTRINELLKREIGDALFRVLLEPGLDLSGVTVTHVLASKDLSRARVLVSVRDPHARNKAIAALRRRRAELQRLINVHLMLKRTPVLHFEIDPSLENGDKILSLLSELEHGNEEPDFLPEQAGETPVT